MLAIASWEEGLGVQAWEKVTERQSIASVQCNCSGMEKV